MLKYTTHYVRMPSEQEASDISQKFEMVSKISQILGIIDGTHVPITAPRDG